MGEVLAFKARPVDKAPDRVPLFSVDGTEYGMLADIPATLAIEAAEYVARHGGAAGLAYVLRRVCGDAAVEALYGAEVSMADIRKLERIAQDHVLGALEEDEGPGKD